MKKKMCHSYQGKSGPLFLMGLLRIYQGVHEKEKYLLTSARGRDKKKKKQKKTFLKLLGQPRSFLERSEMVVKSGRR